MYAIIAHSGQQFTVSEGDVINVDRILAEIGSTQELSDVLLIGGDKVKVGTPHVKGAKVTVEVMAHELGDKRNSFKYRRRHRSRVGRGFRPSTTRLKVQSIKA